MLKTSLRSWPIWNQHKKCTICWFHLFVFLGLKLVSTPLSVVCQWSVNLTSILCKQQTAIFDRFVESGQMTKKTFLPKSCEKVLNLNCTSCFNKTTLSCLKRKLMSLLLSINIPGHSHLCTITRKHTEDNFLY